MKKAAFTLLLLAATGLFISLGIWQLERLAWKRDLIAHTETKLAAAPLPAPLGDVTESDTYTRITAQGTYLQGKDTFVVASTRLGRGFWVLTPLQIEQHLLLINRGFVTSAQRATLTTHTKPVTITGLLRLTEPNGSLIQANNPAQNLWYARDVTAIAKHHNLTNIRPYFLDADATTLQPPVGGLTIVHFRNNHLQYALTWFGMALLGLVGLAVVLRSR